MSAERRPTRAPLLAAAGIAAASGLLAVLTLGRGFAAVAGLASAMAALLALRSASHPREVGPSAEPDPSVSGPTPTGPDAPPRAAPIALPPVRDREVAPDAPAPDGPFAAPGMLTAEFFATTLRGRVAVARRALRPMSLVYFEVLELDASGKRSVPVAVVAGVLGETLREADTAGLVGEDCFACILEDTGSDGAVWTAERIRRNLAGADPGRRFRAGIACYPNHGLDVAELHAKATVALTAARDWSRDRIEVALGGS